MLVCVDGEVLHQMKSCPASFILWTVGTEDRITSLVHVFLIVTVDGDRNGTSKH